MPAMTLQQVFELALQHHQAGRLAEAEALYRQILAVEPRHPDSLDLLGVICSQAGRDDLAADLIGRAIAIAPWQAAYHSNLGNALRALGRLHEATAAYRRAVQLQPDFGDAHNNLGSALKDAGEVNGAIVAFQRAIQCRADRAEFHANLAGALRDRGRLADAEAAYRQALAFRPDLAEAWHGLGIVLNESGRRGEVIAAFGRALQFRPESADFSTDLGNALCMDGRVDEAIAAFQRAIGCAPNHAQAHLGLGHALNLQGRFDEAMAASRAAADLSPHSAVAHSNFGFALIRLGRLDEGIASYRRAVELQPDIAEIHANLSNALRNRGRTDEAVAASRRAIELRPDYAVAWSNLANALKDAGRMPEAVEAYRTALRQQPDYAQAHSNLLLAMHYLPGLDVAEIFREHRRWEEAHARPLEKFIAPHPNDRDPARRLRIGYVSSDFRSHVIAQFLVPLLEAHDHSAFEVCCYASVPWPDSATARLRKSADVWRDVAALNDAALAQQIREDRIDVLVDLTQHLANNRLPVFARKPAPVQVAWLGYPGSTGLRTMDWRLTDARMEPEGCACSESVEKVMRLPDSWFCFDPLDEYPVPRELPAPRRGHVTFACLNNFCKVNEAVIGRWANVMHAVQDSRLLLQCPEGDTQARVREFFAAHGIGLERLELCGWMPTRGDFLKLFDRIDIALDPFPYNGGTTTAEALWMGIPVLTLPENLAVSRIGLSILMAAGMPEFVAQTEDEYVRLAAGLAADLPRLAQHRATLRGRMKTSAFMDGPRFAKNFEGACREMWLQWCALPA